MNEHLNLGDIHARRVSAWERLAGVYYLFHGDEVVYIGQTTNLYARMGMHKNKQFDSFSLLTCAPEELNRLEKEAIYHFCPLYNRGSHTTPPGLIEYHKVGSILGLKSTQVNKALKSNPLEKIWYNGFAHYEKGQVYAWAKQVFNLQY